jgi:hypothetical protein
MAPNLDESDHCDKPNHPEKNAGTPQTVPHDIDPTAFVKNLVGNTINWAHERPALSWVNADGKQPVTEWRETAIIGPKFTHVSVGLFRINSVADRAKFLRRAESWTGNLAIVLDDVGEEKHGATLTPPKLKPTVIIETKPGSEQWWYVFTQPFREASAIDRMMRTLIKAGHADAGGSTGRTALIRLARLPGSDPKGRGFPARIVFEDWKRRFVPNPEMLFGPQGFDLPMESSRPILVSAGQAVMVQSGDDPLLTWLSDTGQTLEAAPNSQGWIAVRCPFADEHTGGSVTGSGYRVSRPSGVNCYHGSCAHRQPHDFFAAWHRKGAPVLPALEPADFGAANARWGHLLDLSRDLQAVHLTIDRKSPIESDRPNLSNAMPLAMALARCRLNWQEIAAVIAGYWLQENTPDAVEAARVLAWRATEMMKPQHDAYDDLHLNPLPRYNPATDAVVIASMETKNG